MIGGIIQSRGRAAVVSEFGRIISRMSSVLSTQLPPKPQPPADADCCNSDCSLCVKDIYDQEVKIWQDECRNIQLGQAPKSSLSPSTYTKCQLIDIRHMTHNTSVYTFDSKGYVEILPGQHLIVRDLINGGNVTRQYTPIAVPQPDDLTFKILIKHYAEGLLTSQLSTRWNVGTHVEWRGPHGTFIHEPNKFMKYVMLAGGTGVAPMLNIARAITADDGDITNLKLLYSNQTYEDLLLKAELKELAHHWNFTYKLFFSQDARAKDKKSYGDNIASRRLSIEDIKSEITNVRGTRVLICGTRQFDASVLEICQSHNIPPENIFKF